jgi:hypothetical protein
MKVIEFNCHTKGFVRQRGGTSNKEFDLFYGNDEERTKMTYKIKSNLQYTRYYMQLNLIC